MTGDTARFKQQAGEQAAALVEPGMVIGLGSKLSPRLGTHWPLPVEVIAFGWRSQARFLEGLGAVVAPREPDGALYHTDQGNMILDCRFGPIADLVSLAGQLDARAGVVEHGLFIGIAHDLFVAGAGGVRHVRRGSNEASAG